MVTLSCGATKQEETKKKSLLGNYKEREIEIEIKTIIKYLHLKNDFRIENTSKI